MSEKYGVVRVSSPTQKPHLLKQGQEMVEFGVREENLLKLLKIVGSARPKKRESDVAGGSPRGTPRGSPTGLTWSQKQISSLMDSLPPGSELVVTNPSRFSRDYFFAVHTINKFYKRGCVITIVKWKYNKNKAAPTPLQLGDLQLLYGQILGDQGSADRIATGSQVGIASAKARGISWGGSCKKLTDKIRFRLKKELESIQIIRGVTLRALQAKYKISRATLFRYRKLFELMNK